MVSMVQRHRGIDDDQIETVLSVAIELEIGRLTRMAFSPNNLLKCASTKSR
jgi:hypothetical protein